MPSHSREEGKREEDALDREMQLKCDRFMRRTDSSVQHGSSAGHLTLVQLPAFLPPSCAARREHEVHPQGIDDDQNHTIKVSPTLSSPVHAAGVKAIMGLVEILQRATVRELYTRGEKA